MTPTVSIVSQSQRELDATNRQVVTHVDVTILILKLHQREEGEVQSVGMREIMHELMKEGGVRLGITKSE